MLDEDLHELYITCAKCLSAPVFLLNFSVFIATRFVINSSRDDLRAATLLLGNIALADMAQVFTILLGVFFSNTTECAFICAAILGATVACTLTSMCCIALIALDRYFFIVHSIRYDHYMTEYRARNLMNLSWVLGILFGFVPVIVKGFFKNEQDSRCRFVSQENIDVMLIAGGFAFPLLIATFALYMAVYLKARTVSKSSFQKTGVQRLKTRSVVVVFLSSSCFLVTWGPYLVSLMIYGCMCGGNVNSDRPEMCRTLEGLMSSPFPMLGFFNSLMNPIIFAWWHRPFTRALFDIFCPARARLTAQTRSMDISTITTNA